MEDIATINSESSGSDLKKWKELLESDYWKLPPNWTLVRTKPKGWGERIKGFPGHLYEFLVVRISYEDYFASQLRNRYMDIEGDFRTSLQDNRNPSLSEFIKELLILSKQILEKDKLEKTDLLSVSSLLDQADERMIWIMPKDVKISKIYTLKLVLEKSSLEIKRNFENLLNVCQKHLEAYDEKPANASEDVCNANIEQIVKTINKNILAQRINKGLQIERLRSLRFWGIILLFFFILLFPLTSNFYVWPPYDVMVEWKGSAGFMSTYPKWMAGAWAVALGFCIIGGIGGFLSGLLQIRNTETNLELYEESVLLFQIRPVFGAFAALVAFMLLSWGVFESFINKGTGSYALIAFLSGFSERYFLQLLSGKSSSGEEEKKNNDPDQKK
jgi:hypothetical protein